jgi:hypothetical protein
MKNENLITLAIIAVAGVAAYYLWNKNRVQNAVVASTQGGVGIAATGLGAGIAALAGGIGTGIGNLFGGLGTSIGGGSTYDDSGSYDYSDDYDSSMD